MTDYLSRAWRFQLTTAMENLVRSAVFEVSQIFEESLHDHQVELARKGEEIAHLKVKLQRAEMKLTDMQSKMDISITQTTQRQSEEAPEESTLHEIDFEVPDDWRVPLGSEIMVKQENPCPSVRLKQFSIPLWPIPLKHEAFLRLEESSQHHNRDKPDIQEKDEPKIRRKRGRPRIHPLKSDTCKDAIVSIKQEPSETEVAPPMRGKGRKRKKHKSSKQKKKANKATDQQYQCRFCPQVFDTAFGLSVHDRAHKKCRACKKVFPFPSTLRQHKVGCKYYKRLMKLSMPAPIKKEKSPNIQPTKKNTSVESTTPTKRIFRRFSCKKCMRRFVSQALLLKHSCNFVCQICSRRFTSQMTLNVHKGKMHKKQIVKKKEPSWTEPLEEGVADENNVPESNGKVTRCKSGFKCLSCEKVFATRCNALEHHNSHTGERPFACRFCSKSFPRRSSLSQHRIKFHGMHIKTYLKCACSKRFMHRSKYKSHILNCSAVLAQTNKK